MKTRHRFLLLLSCLLFHLAAYAQQNGETAVRQILSAQSAAWNKGDIESFMKGYWKSDSLLFIGKKGLTYGWTNTLNNYRKNYPGQKAMGRLQFTILAVKQLSAEYQEVVGKWHLEREEGDLEGHFTLLFQKINDEWLIVMDHSS